MFKKVSTLVFLTVLSTHSAIGASSDGDLLALAAANAARLAAPLESDRLVLTPVTNAEGATLAQQMQVMEFEPEARIIRAGRDFDTSLDGHVVTIPKGSPLGYVELCMGDLREPVPLKLYNIFILPHLRQNGIATEALGRLLAAYIEDGDSITLPGIGFATKERPFTHNHFVVENVRDTLTPAKRLCSNFFGYPHRAHRIDRVSEYFSWKASFTDVRARLYALQSPAPALSTAEQLAEMDKAFAAELSSYIPSESVDAVVKTAGIIFAQWTAFNTKARDIPADNRAALGALWEAEVTGPLTAAQAADPTLAISDRNIKFAAGIAHFYAEYAARRTAIEATEAATASAPAGSTS